MKRLDDNNDDDEESDNDDADNDDADTDDNDDNDENFKLQLQRIECKRKFLQQTMISMKFGSKPQDSLATQILEPSKF